MAVSRPRAAPPHVPTIDSRWSLLFFAAICVAFILPPHRFGSLSVGGEDLVAVTMLPIVLLALGQFPRRAWSPTIVAISLTWFLLILHGVLFGLIASRVYLGYFDFPSEMWQYVKRAIYFIVAFYLVAHRNLSVKKSLMLLLVVLWLTTVIGLLQLGTGSISDLATSLYARTDQQLENAVGQLLNVRRTIGISGFSTSWGGFAVFIAALSLPLVVAPRARLQGLTAWHQFFGLLVFSFALVNIAFSGSRAAVVALLVLILAQMAVNAWAWRSSLRVSVRTVAILVALIGGFAVLAADRIAFVLFRFAALVESGGGSRSEQVLTGLRLLDSWPAWANGIGNVAQREFGIPFGIEVEPVYLLVNYGLIGLLLRYGLLLFVFVAAFKLVRSTSSVWERLVGIASINAIAAYMAFSIGYFFFQEPTGGVAPWAIFGLCIGALERRRRLPAREAVRPELGHAAASLQ